MRDTRWLLSGESDTALEGWTPLANNARPFCLPFDLPEARPHPLERFAVGLPPDAEASALVNAALWAILELCPTQAILDRSGVPLVFPGILRPPRRRDESSNRNVTLSLGYVGSGDDGEAGAAEQFGEAFVGRPVLLRSDELAKALRKLGLAAGDAPPPRASTVADEASARKELLAYLRANPGEQRRSAELKQLLAPDLSGRAWARVWSVAAGEFPSISRPGRPRQKPRT